MSSLDDVNTVDQVAAYLKITPAKVTRLRYEHKIGFLKNGNVVTYPREAIEAYVKANTTDAAPANPHGLSNAGLSRMRSR